MDLLAATTDQLRDAAVAHFKVAKGAGVAAAIHRSATRDGAFDPQALGLGEAACAGWRALAQLQLPRTVDEVVEPVAGGEVRKRLLRLHDGLTVESVHLPMGRGRSSLCVSTQAGCARACTFCETGRMGLRRNLTAGEIVGQVTVQHRVQRPDTIVFQGMGEPLDNLEHLLQAMAVLTDRAGLGYAHDRLTVCTVGHVPGIAALRQLGQKRLNLSLSLNAADDRQRAAIMPNSVRYALAEIQQALRDFRQRANLALGIHWCLLPGINDTPADADRIAAFCAPLGRLLLHVIPYNPGSAPITRAPDEHEVVRFVGWLRDRGVPVRRRITKGRTVMAGCGQLGAAGTQLGAAATSSRCP
ncbi:MAG: radical SAM protein [Planctomycetes bacterium]|nr:radical SAM protein [Planctomycetota bacterium]